MSKSRTLYFGPNVVDVSAYQKQFGDDILYELLEEANDAVEKLGQWIEHDEDEQE